MDEDVDEYSYNPTKNEQKWISALMVQSAFFSICGSAIIIFYVWVNHKKKQSPYRRILLAMSVCDIVSTMGYALQPFLALQGYPNSFVWAIGNKQSCAAVGALTQFGFSAHFYSAAVAFYFVATIRYGMRETAFAHKYEKWIHGFILLWSIGTPIAGLVMDVFHLNPLGPGCWVSCWPVGECSGYTAYSVSIAYGMGGIPVLISFIGIFVCNMLLFCYVRQTVREGERKSKENENKLASYRQSSDVTGTQSLSQIDPSGIQRSKGNVLRSTDKQWKRVKEVGQQSFLYVWAYLSCYFWAIVKQILVSQEFEKVEGSGAYILPMLILQSLFLPAQGAWNCLIFFRPKYLQTRRKFRDQTRFWAARRCVLGNRVRPAKRNVTARSTRFNQESLAQSRIGGAGELSTRESTRESTNVLPETIEEPETIAPESSSLSRPQTGVNMAGEVLPVLPESEPEPTLET